VKIAPRPRWARTLYLVIEWLVVVGLAALWLLIFFGLMALLAMAAVYW
jgi:hypothetical protein